MAFSGNNSLSKALNTGIKVAKRFKAELQFLYVAKLSDIYHQDSLGSAQLSETLETLKEEGKEVKEVLNRRDRRLFEAATRQIRESGLPTKEMVRIGSPEEEIAGAVEAVSADLVVMGTHSEKPVLTEDLETIAENSPCSLLLVAPGWTTLMSK